MVAMGLHLVMDLRGCDSDLLGDLSHVWECLYNFPDALGMKRLTQPYVFPYRECPESEWGITGFVVIAESHVSIHTYPARRYAFVDVFSCRPFDHAEAQEWFSRFFGAGECDSSCVVRGLGWDSGK